MLYEVITIEFCGRSIQWGIALLTSISAFFVKTVKFSGEWPFGAFVYDDARFFVGKFIVLAGVTVILSVAHRKKGKDK